jgi:hypothetical protein
MNITPFVQQCIRERISTDPSQLRHIMYSHYDYEPNIFGNEQYLAFSEPGRRNRAVVEMSFNPACIQFQAKGLTGLNGNSVEVYNYAWDEIDSIDHGTNMLSGGWMKTNRFRLEGMGAKLLDMSSAVIILNSSLARLYSYGQLPYVQKGVALGYIHQFRLNGLFDNNGFVHSDAINAFGNVRSHQFKESFESIYQISMRMSTWL